MSPRDVHGPTAPSAELAPYRYMEHAPLPFAVTRGAKHSLVYANVEFCRVAGLTDQRWLGAPIVDAFAGPTSLALSAILDQSVAEGSERIDVALDIDGDFTASWRCAVWPVVASEGSPDGLAIELRKENEPETTLEFQRQLAERMLLGALRERGLADDAEAARRRAAFLAEAGRLLAEAADQAGTLVVLTKLALPTLGSWCVVELLTVGNSIQRLGIFHPDPDKQRLARDLESRWTPLAGDPFGAAAMLKKPETLTISTNIESMFAAVARRSENLDTLRKLGLGTLLTVPLMARGKLLGALTFVSPDRNGPYDPADIHLAEDLAHRGALALDNAQLYDTAVLLQRSAETANRAKSAFLSAMSHELRTPLNAIGGYVELLEMGLRGPVTDAQRADLTRIKTNQNHLLILITEILNYARIGGGHATYRILDFDTRDIIDRALELLEPLIAQHGLICSPVACATNVIVRADPEKVTQILVNLLSNAIKFTPTGGRVTVECEATADRVSIRVGDTGIGVPPDKHELIFEPFVQLKDGLSEREGGVGLGLAISRDLARAMDGDITVESRSGEGARFTLSLPRGELTGPEQQKRG